MATRPYIPTAIRWAVWERDNFTCQSCGSRRFLSLDHRVPFVDGGQDNEDNLWTLCSFCNSRKGRKPAVAYIPREAALALERAAIIGSWFKEADVVMFDYITQAREAGASLRQIADAVGVSYEAVRQWLKAGRK